MKKTLNFLKKFWLEIIFFTIAFIFSFWLMWHTFGYKNHIIYIAAKAWSDFSANLPLIRSFSWGHNFPPGDPLLAGVPNTYHFLFYLIVGTLEHLNFRLDFALNLPSALGFLGLIILIFLLAKLLFKSRFVAFLSVIFFIFNGSFAFLEFFKIHPLSWQTPVEIFQNNIFPSFGPYDGKIVSAFWNLNIYTNQRHLAAAFALLLTALFLILKPIVGEKPLTYRRAILVGSFLGLTPFFHSVGFFMGLAVFGILFLLCQNQRKPLFVLLGIAFALGAPQLLLMQPGGVESNFRFHPGYLIANHLTFSSFINYWFLNLGLALILIPWGFAKSSPLAKKVFWAFFSLFLIGNLFQFSREMAANHKFFNFFLIIGNMFGAYAIWLIWQKSLWRKILAIIFIFFLTLSGIIDFFAVKNDSWIKIEDAPLNPDITWIKENTPPQSFFLNSSYLYHPASLAGRKIFLGWPYFPWAGGYNTDQRGKIMKNIYEGKDKNKICNLLIDNKISYFTTEDTRGDENLPKIDPTFFQTIFKSTYSNPKNNFRIYEVKENCLAK